MVFQIEVVLPGETEGDGPPPGMVMDAVEVFEIDEDGLIIGLKAYWDMSRARPRV